MEERPHLNPHRDRELQVGRAADRFEAGPSTVKAARIDPVVTRGRMAALGAGAWQSFKDWRSMQGNPSAYGTYGKERFRPPAVETEAQYMVVDGRLDALVPALRATDPLYGKMPMYYQGPVERYYLRDIVGLTASIADGFEQGDFMSVQDLHQEWNSHNASTS
tara:strand:+ start:685 stop:1173 length:489 start_codon:yes stop_codon:yes gene_type:complete